MTTLVLAVVVASSASLQGSSTQGETSQQRPEKNPPPAADGSQKKPLDLNITEEAGITLMTLDVEVRDPQGRPVRGLSKDDFVLSLGPRPWPIYSVDDLCDCDDQGEIDLAQADTASSTQDAAIANTASSPTLDEPVTAGAAASASLPADASSTPSSLPARNFAHTIIYFDFSQFQVDGRSRAFEAATRWARETMQPTDSVMVVGYTSGKGLVQLLPFTHDRDRLLATLAAAEKNEDYLDDFPLKFKFRVRDCLSCIKSCATSPRVCYPLGCDQCCVQCTAHGQEEFRHGRRALTALREFLAQLEKIPGRKNLIFLHQNNVMFPGRFYRFPAGEADFYIGTHVKLVEDVGAEATASRTTLYSLQTGPNQMFTDRVEDTMAGYAVNLGANLADFTGGDYGRAPQDLITVMDRVGRRCACIYRITFKPPDPERSRVYNARVNVKGKRLPFSYRVRHLLPGDRTARTAQVVLNNPAGWTDVPVHAALVPTRRSGKKWDLELSIILSLDALRTLPLGGRQVARLDVGAILQEVYQHGGGDSWEMLVGTEIRKTSDSTSDLWVVHQRQFLGMKPGRYRVSAFVRNRDRELFGGAETTIDLPKKSDSALVGPVLLRPDSRYFLAALPTHQEAGKVESQRPETRSGPLPVSPEIQRGDPLVARTWLCSSAKRSISARSSRSGPTSDSGALLNPDTLTRYLVRRGESEPLPGAPDVSPFDDGCVEITDSLPTRNMEAGLYNYVLVWQPPGKAEPLSAQQLFRVVEAAGTGSHSWNTASRNSGGPASEE